MNERKQDFEIDNAGRQERTVAMAGVGELSGYVLAALTALTRVGEGERKRGKIEESMEETEQQRLGTVLYV